MLLSILVSYRYISISSIWTWINFDNYSKFFLSYTSFLNSMYSILLHLVSIILLQNHSRFYKFRITWFLLKSYSAQKSRNFYHTFAKSSPGAHPFPVLRKLLQSSKSPKPIEQSLCPLSVPAAAPVRPRQEVEPPLKRCATGIEVLVGGKTLRDKPFRTRRPDYTCFRGSWRW